MTDIDAIRQRADRYKQTGAGSGKTIQAIQLANTDIPALLADRDENLAALRDVLAELEDRTAEARGARSDYEELKGINTDLADERDKLRAELAEARCTADEMTRAVKRLMGERDALKASLAKVYAERARTQETAGRCGDVAPSLSLLASRTRPTCRLTAGHPGWHRGDDDSEWTLTQETQP